MLLSLASLMAVASGAATILLPVTEARAVIPPDSCFAFTAGTGTITNYYSHEGNNPANPACPRDVDIPATIGGVAVTTIGAAANPWYPATATSFASKSLTSVTIPSSVTSIGNDAFYGNQLTSITIPSSVTSIGTGAFRSNQLTSVTIPSSVTSIGNYAFIGNRLTSITIPSGVTSIGNDAFYGNRLTSVAIPSSVTSIGNDAFYGNRLTSVAIPSSVTSIGDYAFYGNRLTSVTIPNAAATMQHSSFSGNPLSSMTIGSTTYTEQSPTTEPACFVLSGSTLTDYHQASPLVARDNGMLCGRDVSIPSSVTSIGNDAFYGNQLTSITIPSSVTSIGTGAFRINQLTSVTIPSSVTSIGFGAFAIQSQWGDDLDGGTNGAPDFWSDDPAEVQAAYDEIWYVRLYTEDPSNPNSLVDSILNEGWWWGMDANANGLDDSLGGHIVNPSSVELQYLNQSNASLRSPDTFTGMLSGTPLTNYMVTEGPTLPMPADPSSPTLEEQAAIDAALSAYYRLGDEVSLAPPAFTGYVTPVTQLFTLASAENSFSYTYSPTPTAPVVSVGKVAGIDFNGETNSYTTSSVRPTFSGTASPGATIEVEIHSDPILLTTSANGSGEWSVTPSADLPLGDHTVCISATLNGITTELDSFVLSVTTGSTQEIPNTGTSTTQLRLGGLALLLLGIGLQRIQRRKRQSALAVPQLFP